MKYLLLLPTFLLCLTLSAQDKPLLVVSSGHHSTVRCVDISPDGKYVASGGEDNVVKLYDLRMKQELNTFTGHSQMVLNVGFSPDGKYIVSSSQREYLVYTHPEGKFVKNIPNNYILSKGNFSITKDLVLYVGNKNDGLQSYNILDGTLSNEYKDIKATDFVVLPDGKTLICKAYEGETPGIGIYSLPEGTRTSFIPVEGLLLENFALSADGNKIAFELKASEVAVIDLKTKTVGEPFKVGVGALNVLKISPDGKQLITVGYDNVVRFWDTNSGKSIKEVKDLSPSSYEGISMVMLLNDMDFTADGKMAVFAYGDLDSKGLKHTVEWFKTKTMVSMGKHQGSVKMSTGISIDQSGKILSTGTLTDAIGVKCLDLTKGSQKAFIPGTSYLGSGGKYLAAVNNTDNSKPKLEIYRMPALRLTKSFDIYGFAIISMSSSGKFAAAIDQKYTPDPDPSKPQVVPYIRVWNVESGKEQVHIEGELMESPFVLKFSADEKQLIAIYAKTVKIIDLASGKIIKTTDADIETGFQTAVSSDGKTILYAERSEIVATDFNTGEKKTVLTLEKGVVGLSVTFNADKTLLSITCIATGQDNPNRVLVYDWTTKTKVCEMLGHTAITRVSTFGPKSKHLYSVDDNGIIAMWDIEQCKVKASFLAFGAEDFLITSPDGYYKASKGNMGSIGFRHKGGLYTFEQFDLKYNRPDKVLESIGMASEKQIAMYTKAYNKRLARMGFSPDNFSDDVHAPDIEIVDKEELPLNTTAGSIDINIKASDVSLPLDRLNVTVNGIPIYGKRGKTLKSAKKKNYEGKLKIDLVAGLNKIKISVMNSDGTESVAQNYTIDCKKAAVKPDLYIVAFGVQAYKDSTMNLTYSHKDAQDLVDLFEKNGGSAGHYNKVHVKILTNNDVLKENAAELKSELQNSRIDDQVILFYSGHGLLDEQLDYFLSTYDVDFASPAERGLPFEDFRDLIDGIPARNRLILVDACHSGEVDKDEVAHAAPEHDAGKVKTKSFTAKGKKVIGLGNSFELMKELFVELRKESGATIIASSAGKEFSLESDVWKNGVFTFALKEGMIDLKADANDDKKVTVSELKKYLFTRVKELTDGKQTPTVRSENLQHDYVIY